MTLSPEKLDEAKIRIKAGATEDDLAAWLRMPVKRVKKLLRSELRSLAAEAKHEILSQLYEAATSGDNLTATMFSAKARYGWRDTGLRETPSLERWPNHTVEVIGAARE